MTARYILEKLLFHTWEIIKIFIFATELMGWEGEVLVWKVSDRENDK